MADATSSAESGGSAHSERSGKKAIHRTHSHAGSKPRTTNSDSSWYHLSPSSEERLIGDAVQYMNGDREIVRQAVAIVLGATSRKRGLKGAISLCTEVSNLLQTNRSLQRHVILQKRELDVLRHSKKSPPQSTLSSSSNESNRFHRRHSTQTKTTQVRPMLTDRSTSPLLKELHVKSLSHQACQTDVLDTAIRDPSDMTQDDEKLSTIQDNLRLKKELQNVKSELEALKKKQSLLPIISEGQAATSKVIIQPTMDQLNKGKIIWPVPPAYRQSEAANREIELPQIPQAKGLGEVQDGKQKIFANQQKKKGFRPFSSPVKVSPNPATQHHPIRPSEMYSQCKCPGCVRAVAEENITVWCDQSHTADKKSLKQSEVLPCIGDHVVVRSHLTGVVKYIGPLSGDKQSYVGLHLDSPVGDHSGSVDGVQYFSCPPNYGAFVRMDDVLCITSPRTLKDKQTVGSSTSRQRSSSSPTSACTRHKKTHRLRAVPIFSLSPNWSGAKERPRGDWRRGERGGCWAGRKNRD